MPFNAKMLANIGRLEDEQDLDKRNVADDEEMDVVSWVCARFLPCMVPAKMIPQLENGKLFDIVSFDDVAFLLLLFEDSYSVWPRMAKAELERQQRITATEGENEPRQPPAKKVCRGAFKGEKKFRQGNGLSGKVAQSRFKTLRSRIWRYRNCDSMVVEIEKAYNTKIKEFQMWEEENNLRSDGASTQGALAAGGTSTVAGFVDEVSRQMLEAYKDILPVII